MNLMEIMHIMHIYEWPQKNICIYFTGWW